MFVLLPRMRLRVATGRLHRVNCRIKEARNVYKGMKSRAQMVGLRLWSFNLSL